MEPCKRCNLQAAGTRLGVAFAQLLRHQDTVLCYSFDPHDGGPDIVSELPSSFWIQDELPQPPLPEVDRAASRERCQSWVRSTTGLLPGPSLAPLYTLRKATSYVLRLNGLETPDDKGCCTHALNPLAVRPNGTFCAKLLHTSFSNMSHLE